MVLFAHFQNENYIDIDALIKGLAGFGYARPFDSRHQNEENGNNYYFDDHYMSIEVIQRDNKPDLVTITLDIDRDVRPEKLDLFKSHVSTLEVNGLTAVLDHDLFSDSESYHASIYWGAIHSFIDSCRPRIPRIQDSLSPMIDARTDKQVNLKAPRNKTFHVGDDVGIEYRAVKDIASFAELQALQEQHFTLLKSLARFIQYVDVSKRSGTKADLKVAVHVDEVLELSYDLLSRPKDHNAFTAFIGKLVEIYERDKETLYHTLDFVRSSVVLARNKLAKSPPAISEVLENLQQYGSAVAIMEKLKLISNRYQDLERINMSRLVDSRYSEHGFLRTLVDIESNLSNESRDSDLDKIFKLMLRYGSFNTYHRSMDSTSAGIVLSTMRKKGFNIDIFTSDNLSRDTFTREQMSLESWEENFHDLIMDLHKPLYDVFFTHSIGEKEEIDRALRDKVLSLSKSVENTREKGIPYILNKVKGMLHHCRTRKNEKSDKVLIDLEEKLEQLEIQLEFGGRPTGGMLYSRPWHRIPEDFSREDFMHCCAALGGDKQDLTFMTIYNPTYTYLTHFIKGIDSQLGFSILKAGMIEGKRVLLSISPYEANPGIRTALGPAETYRYVLDAMVKTAHDARAEYLLIDDIDLKVRDANGAVVIMKEGTVKKIGEQGYENAEDIVIKYKNGEPCAPRSFIKFVEKASKKYNSIAHEDVAFEQIAGDNKLVEEQFGEGRYHYSIQSAKATFDPDIDYANFPYELTKAIFDDGYHTQNSTRTVFKVNVAKYIEERKKEDVDLLPQTISINGISRT